MSPAWSATGGVIDQSGSYTGGSITGTFAVTGSDAASGLSANAQVTITPSPTLVQVSLAPASVTLSPNAIQQFVASGLMSDGSTVPISATFSTTGGTITVTGVYTAPGIPGTFLAVASDAASGLADSSIVNVVSGSNIIADVDFTAGGYSCGGVPCSFPWRRAKGITSGALELDWFPGAVDYTPVWIGFPPSNHIKMTATFRLDQPMGNTTSNIKVWRMSNPNRTTIYHPPSGVWGHYWDGWTPNLPNAFIGICEAACPGWVPRNLVFAENIADDQWHTFSWEIDVRGSTKQARFWFDGQQIMMSGNWAADGYQDSSITWNNGTLFISSSIAQPTLDNLGLVEEFSGCCSNSGRMLIDRVVIEDLP